MLYLFIIHFKHNTMKGSKTKGAKTYNTAKGTGANPARKVNMRKVKNNLPVSKAAKKVDFK